MKRRSSLAMAGGGLVNGIAGTLVLLTVHHFVATLLAGALYGYVVYRLLGFPPRPGKCLIVACAGGFGFLAAYFMALQGTIFLLAQIFPIDRIQSLQWVATFPTGGLIGSTIFLGGLRAAGVRLPFRTVAGFVLMNVPGSYACLFLNSFGIPVWQSLTAFALGPVRLAEAKVQTIAETNSETPGSTYGASPQP
jgi:hypothetical protein